MSQEQLGGIGGIGIGVMEYTRRHDELVRYVRNMIRMLGISGGRMGTEHLSRLRAEVLGLSDVERAELALALVRSLDEPADADSADAWDEEILRRLAEIDAGTAKLIDRSEFRRRMQARLGSR